MSASGDAIGFFGAHQQAIENLLPIAAAVRALGHEVFFLDADPLFHQATGALVTRAGFPRVPFTDASLPRPLALYGGMARARVMLGLRRATRARASLARVWMLCGDNAPHRALIELAPRGVFSVLAADAVFAEARLPWRLIARHASVADGLARGREPLRTAALHAASAGRVSWLLPGRSGHSAADVMVLAGQYSMDVVRASRGNVPLYWPVGLPRFARRRAPVSDAATSPRDRRLRVAVFPSAFGWHGHRHEQAIQNAVVHDLAAALSAHHDALEVVVKKHPREEPDVYRELAARYPGIRVDLESDAGTVLDWTDIIVTMLSSVALEAVLLGKPALLTGWGIEWWRMHGTPFAHPNFPRPSSADAMVRELLALRSPGELAGLIQRQGELRNYLFAPTTPEAAERVAAVLVAGLQGAAQGRRAARDQGATPP